MTLAHISSKIKLDAARLQHSVRYYSDTPLIRFAVNVKATVIKKFPPMQAYSTMTNGPLFLRDCAAPSLSHCTRAGQKK